MKWPASRVEGMIYFIRGQRVMLDFDLAGLYGVTTGNLNKAVQRNRDRFPADFVFHVAPQEVVRLMFQNGISKTGRGGRQKPVMAFTEQGVAMLSGVLRSQRAVEVNVAIMRAFVKLREVLSAHRDLAEKLAELERRVANHDEGIETLFDAIRRLMAPPEPTRKQIGFQVRERSSRYVFRR
jgi:hypothetical protein